MRHPALRALLVALGICAVLGACSQKAMLRTLAPPEADRFAREFVRDLRRGDTAATGPRLSPRLQQLPGVRDSIAGMVRFFPRGPVNGIELIGAQVQVDAQATRRFLEYQEQSAGGWAVIQLFLLEDEGGNRYVDAVHVSQIAAPLQRVNAFTLAGKGPRHWLMLAAAVGVTLFCLWAAVLVIRTPMRRRWGWALVALVGGGKLTLNWTTGDIFATPLNLQLLGSAVARTGLAGPWLLSVAIPAGALMALLRRRRFLAGEREPGEERASHGDTEGYGE
jgi:hypothetical protein